MRKKNPGCTSRVVTRHRIGLAVATLISSCMLANAQAGEFILDNGMEGRWALNASIGTSFRTSTPDPALIALGNGGTGNSSHDDGNLNFANRGDTFSTMLKSVGELQLKQGDYGVFLRAKAWYDYQLMNKGVPHGSSANAFESGARLNDNDFDRLSKFSGVDLADAYVFANTTIGEDSPLSVKFGKHVVNWGESVFISGINQYGAVDVSALRRPGAEIKEVLIPIPQISASFGFAEDWSLEGFYQFKWQKNILDGCGTYWSGSDLTNCSNVGALAGTAAGIPDGTYFNQPVNNAALSNYGNIEPEDGGQFGFALRHFVPSLSTDFGLYYVNYHQRSPIASILFDKTTIPGSVFNTNAYTVSQADGRSRALQTAWDWSAENIQVLGLSASTSLAGWSLGGEVSYTKDVPVQLNGVDLLRGATSGAGPLPQDPEFLNAMQNRNTGILYHGYDRKDKSQIQVSTIKVFPRIMGAESVSLLGEIGFQHWSGIGDPSSDRRYGRGFVYGQAVSSAPGQLGATAAACSGTANVNASYCEANGFATSNAWGYRVRAEASYPNVFAGVNVKPRVFFSHDVKGYSADATFVEDRMILGLGARFDYLNKYYADISYNLFNHAAKYDIFHDRDFASVVVGINF